MSEVPKGKNRKIRTTGLSDIAAERALLAGIFQHGKMAYYDVCDVIDIECITDINNQLVYKCLANIIIHDKTIDIPTVLSSANELGITDYINTPDQLNYIGSLIKLPVQIDNTRKHAIKLKKLQIARMAQQKHKEAYAALSEVDGTETVDKILSISERPLLELSFSLNSHQQDRPMQIAEGGREYLEDLIANPVTNIGIPTPYARYNKVIGGGLRNGGVNLIAARPKAQPMSSKILTPNGWVLMKDIKIGDVICHPFNGTSNVINIIPNGLQNIVKFMFDDGTFALASEDHLWKIKSRRWEKYQILSYNEISKTKLKENDRHKWQIPLTNPVEFSNQNVAIHPYLLGVLIGCGCMVEGCRFSTADMFILDKLNSIISEDYEIKKIGKSKYDYSICKKNISNKPNYYTENLKKYNLFGQKSHTKFIPKEYLYNSIEFRLQLLQGLMDAGGYVSDNYNLEYSTTSEELSNNFAELIMSLGGKCKIKKRFTICNGKKIPSFRCRTKPSLKKKIIGYQHIGKLDCQCITIDNDDGLYITDNYIVTHNCGKTTFGKEISLHVSGKLKIPVLFLDTEMVKTDQYIRSLASIAKIPINRIETGQFGQNEIEKKRVFDADTILQGMFYKHVAVAGKAFDEIISIIRRWILQDVGYGSNGNVNPCLVIYDYFKIMTEDSVKGMEEYQALGFMISKLSDFCKLYSFPVLAFVQINRDGITKETSDIISGSDRLLWLCHSASIWKRKTKEEVENDPHNGNMKLIPLEARFGPSLDEGDYIHFTMDGEKSIIAEGKTFKETKKEQLRKLDAEDDESVEL